MALRNWLQGAATVATLATDRGDSGRSVATVATVARPASNSPAVATPEKADELRVLHAVVAADWPDDEKADALAAALADPEAALTCYRALVAEREAARPPAPADDGMRACTDCANLSPGGRCLAAWRGKSLGAGIGTSRQYVPAMPDRPQRCGAYAPGPNDPDRRSGRERWPYLFTSATPGKPTSQSLGTIRNQRLDVVSTTPDGSPIEAQCAHARTREGER